jgi:hypothetical protein
MCALSPPTSTLAFAVVRSPLTHTNRHFDRSCSQLYREQRSGEICFSASTVRKPNRADSLPLLSPSLSLLLLPSLSLLLLLLTLLLLLAFAFVFAVGIVLASRYAKALALALSEHTQKRGF